MEFLAVQVLFLHYTVYKTTNLVNGKVYIGTHQTDDPMDEYLGSGHNIKRAITKYGVESFRKEILFDFDNASDMFAKEAELVTEEFCERNDTYNLCPGGKGGWGYMNDGSDDHITRCKKGYETSLRNLSPELAKKRARLIWETRERNGTKSIPRENPRRGFTLTQEHKAKIGKANSLKQTGTQNSQYGTIWISNGFERKKIKKVDTIPDGWYRGKRLNKHAGMV